LHELFLVKEASKMYCLVWVEFLGLSLYFWPFLE
jgi:hypothetical protein